MIPKPSTLIPHPQIPNPKPETPTHDTGERGDKVATAALNNVALSLAAVHFPHRKVDTFFGGIDIYPIYD